MKTVTTNFRVPDENYLLLRRLAVEEGMSVNEYLNYLVAEELRRKPLGAKKKEKKKDFYKAMLEFAQEPVKAEPMGLSALDEEIYSV